MKKIILRVLVLQMFIISNAQTTIYTNDMDYVIGDVKQAFIQNKITNTTQADMLIEGFKTMKVNGIRIPIYADGQNPNQTMFDYFYNKAVSEGFPIFANPAQSSGGQRIACGILNGTLCNVKDDNTATSILLNTILNFESQYPCKWINPFNEDGSAGAAFSANQMNTIYSVLSTNLQNAELIGACVWGLPGSINVFNNTEIENYITVATAHNLGFNHSRWSDFIALADAYNLPVWDSEVNHNDKFGTGTRLEKALENKVDGLVMYDSWRYIDLTTGVVNNAGETVMALYLKPIGENLALTGTASQSSENPSFPSPAPLANDGDINGNWGSGSVSLTNAGEINPWWQVDLGSDTDIDLVKVYNRTDTCCKTRLSNFTVFIYDDNGDINFKQTFTSYPDPSVSIDVGNVVGKIIRVQLNNMGGDNYPLALAEVQVYAAEFLSIEETYTNDIRVYPNPVSSNNLEVSIPKAVYNKFAIYNIKGQVMLKDQIANGINKVSINVNKLSKGIYILKMDGVKNSITRKIVKY